MVPIARSIYETWRAKSTALTGLVIQSTLLTLEVSNKVRNRYLAAMSPGNYVLVRADPAVGVAKL